MCPMRVRYTSRNIVDNEFLGYRQEESREAEKEKPEWRKRYKATDMAGKRREQSSAEKNRRRNASERTGKR